ncbi:MAG: DUF1800 family protein [Pyrinomonadaceae bacterium]
MKDHAYLLRGSFAAICASLLVFIAGPIQKASAAPQKSPVLYSSSSSSTRAVALESMTLRAEPFQLTSDGYFGAGDSRTRIALFGTDFEFLQGEGASALSADAQDAAGAVYPLVVEYVGTVPNFDGVYMVIVRLNDSMPANVGDVLMRLRLHGMASNRVRVAIGQVGGGPPDDFPGVGTPAPATPPGAVTPLTLAQYQAQYDSPTFPSDADIIRFLEQSSWGPKGDRSDFNLVRSMGINAYLNQQFSEPVSNIPKGSNYPDLAFPSDDSSQGCPSSLGATAQAACIRDNYSVYPVQRTFVTNALSRPDQLRQRVAFALHQITVVSAISPLDRPSWETMYLQVLDRGAFGNYRTLLQEITFNPEMGEYLDMRLSTRTNPNENFAREILQLFSIGVNELNLDGTVKVDAQGIPIPAYTQTHVNEFTRLFTGWNLVGGGLPLPPGMTGSVTNWRDPMVPRGGTNHDFNPKTLFNGVITPQCSSASGTANTNCAIADLTIGLDNIYNHANVAPFVSKQLIQHLVTSNPSPAYVARVATVFNSNRSNPTQMQEVVKAILLDPEARGDVKTDPSYGKLREPIQYITNILRGFNANSDGVIANRAQGGDLTLNIDQPLLQPPTVFSYYQPEYQVPGTGILGPAFGILSTSTTLRRANVANQLIYLGIGTGTNNPTGTQLNLSSLEAQASNPGAIADALNALLLHGTMGTQFRNSIITAMNAIPTSDGNFARKRAQVAAYLVTTSSQFDIQR